MVTSPVLTFEQIRRLEMSLSLNMAFNLKVVQHSPGFAINFDAAVPHARSAITPSHNKKSGGPPCISGSRASLERVQELDDGLLIIVLQLFKAMDHRGCFAAMPADRLQEGSRVSIVH